MFMINKNTDRMLSMQAAADWLVIGRAAANPKPPTGIHLGWWEGFTTAS